MLTRESLATLHGLRTRFSAETGRQKLEQIRALGDLTLRDPAAVREFHELLLFIAAYPDNRDVHIAAEAQLTRLASATERLTRTIRSASSRLADSGIAGTITRYQYSFEALSWIVRRHPREVALDWDDDSLGATADEFLANLACRVEADAISSGRWTTRRWLSLARGSEDSELGWLLREIERTLPAGPIRDAIFDSLEISVLWKLAPTASRTLCRFPRRRVYYHTDGLQRVIDTAGIVNKPLKPVAPLPPRAAQQLIDAGSASLFVRNRETDPMTYADLREVYLYRLERGIDVAVFGMTPERRLPIESYFGYVAAKNRIPMAYGGGWVLAHRCEIGVNVFDTFRGGESALVFAHILRVYRAMFDVREFRVDPYQFGAGNSEAIRSGAFWFYYRFGFRPTERRLLELADSEAAKIATDRSYRSTSSILRRLAKSTLAWKLVESAETTPDLPSVALAVTRQIAVTYGGERAKAESASLAKLRRVLGVRSMSKWPTHQLRAFARLSPLIAAIPDLSAWSASETRSLVELMRAKGGPLERAYALAVARHPRLIESLRALAHDTDQHEV